MPLACSARVPRVRAEARVDDVDRLLRGCASRLILYRFALGRPGGGNAALTPRPRDERARRQRRLPSPAPTARSPRRSRRAARSARRATAPSSASPQGDRERAVMLPPGVEARAPGRRTRRSRARISAKPAAASSSSTWPRRASANIPGTPGSGSGASRARRARAGSRRSTGCPRAAPRPRARSARRASARAALRAARPRGRRAACSPSARGRRRPSRSPWSSHSASIWRTSHVVGAGLRRVLLRRADHRLRAVGDDHRAAGRDALGGEQPGVAEPRRDLQQRLPGLRVDRRRRATARRAARRAASPRAARSSRPPRDPSPCGSRRGTPRDRRHAPRVRARPVTGEAQRRPGRSRRSVRA